ncbi:velvet factor [Globomyces pollinis-pini]|nr:velvet factor [Globomyces pollinis-pini]
MSQYNSTPHIIIRQQPIQGRMCGIKERADRRVLQPPLIVELEYPNTYDKNLLLVESYMCHLSLFSKDKKECQSVVRYEKNPESCIQKLLLGDDPISGVVLQDPMTGNEGLFFIFPRLSVRFAGIYTICCTVMNMQSGYCEMKYSEPFEVFSSKRYPGGLDSPSYSTCIMKLLKSVDKH